VWARSGLDAACVSTLRSGQPLYCARCFVRSTRAKGTLVDAVQSVQVAQRRVCSGFARSRSRAGREGPYALQLMRACTVPGARVAVRRTYTNSNLFIAASRGFVSHIPQEPAPQTRLGASDRIDSHQQSVFSSCIVLRVMRTGCTELRLLQPPAGRLRILVPQRQA
jgi:hypothetical protein